MPRLSRTLPVALAAGALTLFAPAFGVNAAPDPCAASEVAKTVGAVATSTGAYLGDHPDTDLALTAVSQLPPGPQSLTALRLYFEANPQEAKNLQKLQQPSTALSGRCQLPVALPALLGLIQTAQVPAGSLLGTAASGLSAQAPAAVSTDLTPSSATSGAGPGSVAGPATATAG